jgi:aldehyde:ferredoxin oxidoreductase
MKKKQGTFNLNRETLRALQPASLKRFAAGETGSNPHSACDTCTIGCPTDRLAPQ